ncbi:hypothetical protein [Gloeothece verrucosa]|uniref:Uncharacterized protein n=1 Tax=Gloeothece verrucosa (strain PCC 7822) TaxID=497965 RepID=E0UD66_GLOV7|nr:hypothetical protein [Gloeothece verrucosa]ADN12946.1 hypothetical protein Cyan7822_0932 [Gloeothece verrucosa PCC 7822]
MNMIIPHQQKPFWHRALPIGLGVIVLGSLSAKPVRAGIADFLGNSVFGDIYSQLVSFFPQMIAVDQWISLLEDSVNDPCQAVPILFATPSEPGWCTSATDILGGDSMTGILRDVTGDLGIPDPMQARAQIQEKVDEAGETADPFIINPELYGIELGNLSDRSATSLSAKTVLSDEGQQQMEDEIEQSSEIVQSILDTSDEAQSYDSTQDVVKALTRINAQQSVITAMQQASSLRSRTDTQFTNLNLANISRSLDQQNRDKQAQSTVDGFLLLNLTAQSNLF